MNDLAPDSLAIVLDTQAAPSAAKLAQASAAIGDLRAAAARLEAAGDKRQAAQLWAEICGQASAKQSDYATALRLAHEVGRWAASTALADEAAAKFPGNPSILKAAARIARKNGEWQKVDRYRQAVAGLLPDDSAAARAAAMALIGQPMNRKHRWPEVLRRFDEVQKKFPRDEQTCAAHLGALRGAARWDEAQSRAAEWAEAFPLGANVAVERVLLLEALGRFDDALADLEAFRHRAHPSPQAEAAYSKLLARFDRLDEAEAVCTAALAEFPDDPRLLLEYASIATRRSDWSEALRRLMVARTRLPGNKAIEDKIVTLKSLLPDHDGTSEESPEAGDPLLSQFESLGGTVTGCEFGMIQKRLGIERVGLLRWASLSLAQLTSALDCEFDGVGAEEYTRITVHKKADGRGEYWADDTRFGIIQHTFVQEHEAAADKVLKQTARRMRFLRGKMIEDLRAAERLFIFKIAEATDDSNLRDLLRAFRKYGASMLLCVLPADATHQAGTMRTLGDGLLAGYLSGFMNENSAEGRGIDTAGWQALAMEAYTRHAASGTHPAPPTPAP